LVGNKGNEVNEANESGAEEPMETGKHRGSRGGPRGMREKRANTNRERVRGEVPIGFGQQRLWNQAMTRHVGEQMGSRQSRVENEARGRSGMNQTINPGYELTGGRGSRDPGNKEDQLDPNPAGPPTKSSTLRNGL
jgi:hypothetical protein